MRRNNTQVPVRTFDLFDTLITRDALTPEDIFDRVGSRLMHLGLIAGTPGTFREQRVQADVSTRIRCGREVSLAEIYGTLADLFGWDAAATERAMQAEIDEELKAIRPIVDMAAQWNALAPDAKAILSDTYFSPQTIHLLLERCGLHCQPDRLFLSSQHRRTKRNGDLFAIAQQSLRRSPADILHTGDNLHSDVRMASRHGLRSRWYTASQPTHLEQIFNTHTGSEIAGALRAARLGFPGGSATQRALWDIGTMVAAPILFSFVAWLLDQTRKQGVEHIYFLARDGQILKEIASLIDPSRPASYLYASRQAWHLPSITDAIDETALSWIADRYTPSTLRQILARVEVDPSEVRQALTDMGFPETDWDRLAHDRQKVADLFSHPKIRVLVCQRAAEARSRVLRYLDAEGVTSQQRLAIVDLGWNGRLQRSLARILAVDRGTGTPPISGFYMSLLTRPEGYSSGELHSFYDASLATQEQHALMLELFCSADHGGLRGFGQRSGQIYPVFAPGNEEAMHDWGLPTFRRAVLTATAELVSWMKRSGSPDCAIAATLKHPARLVFEAFVQAPGPPGAEAFGRFPFTYDQNHSQALEMAPRISPWKATALLILGTRLLRLRTIWKEGTLSRSLPPLGSRMALGFLERRNTLIALLRKIIA